MAIRTVFMRPLFAEAFDLARFGSGDGLSVRGNRYIGVADVAFADLLGLVNFMIEGHAVFESDDVGNRGIGSNGIERKQHQYQNQHSQNLLPEKVDKMWIRSELSAIIMPEPLLYRKKHKKNHCLAMICLRQWPVCRLAGFVPVWLMELNQYVSGIGAMSTSSGA